MLHLVNSLPLPQRTGHKTKEGLFWWEGVVCILANSNQHTTPTMLDTLYTSYTYFLRLLPPNIEKEKLQAKLDTNVRTARENNKRLGNYFYQFSFLFNEGQYLLKLRTFLVYCIILPGLYRYFMYNTVSKWWCCNLYYKYRWNSFVIDK